MWCILSVLLPVGFAQAFRAEYRLCLFDLRGIIGVDAIGSAPIAGAWFAVGMNCPRVFALPQLPILKVIQGNDKMIWLVSFGANRLAYFGFGSHCLLSFLC